MKKISPELHRKYVEAGRKGGLAKVPKGFALSGKASEAGKKGGKKSKRGKK